MSQLEGQEQVAFRRTTLRQLLQEAHFAAHNTIHSAHSSNELIATILEGSGLEPLTLPRIIQELAQGKLATRLRRVT